MNINWLLKAKRLVQNPASEKRVWLVLGVIAVCLAIAGAEYMFGGSSDATVTRPNFRMPKF